MSVWKLKNSVNNDVFIFPEINEYDLESHLFAVARHNKEVYCTTKTPKRACVCRTRAKQQCGVDGITYENECQRKCEGKFKYAA